MLPVVLLPGSLIGGMRAGEHPMKQDHTFLPAGHGANRTHHDILQFRR